MSRELIFIKAGYCSFTEVLKSKASGLWTFISPQDRISETSSSYVYRRWKTPPGDPGVRRRAASYLAWSDSCCHYHLITAHTYIMLTFPLRASGDAVLGCVVVVRGNKDGFDFLEPPTASPPSGVLNDADLLWNNCCAVSEGKVTTDMRKAAEPRLNPDFPELPGNERRAEKQKQRKSSCMWLLWVTCSFKRCAGSTDDLLSEPYFFHLPFAAALRCAPY